MFAKKAIDSFVETRIDDELVLMNIDTGSFHALKGTGLAIWQLLDGGDGRTDIIAALTKRYDISAEQCGADVDQFLSDIEAAGFVTLA